MRGDFWHRAMELPELVALSEGPGRLDLLAPGQAELAEMIRRPAEVAGLSFEEDRSRGVRLDADLAEAASQQAGSLPLLSAVLDGLYREDAERSGGRYLTYGTYDTLGRLAGAIARRAEAVLASVFDAEPPADRERLEQQALARMLRALSTIDRSDEGAVTSRSAALSAFGARTPERRMIEAMRAPDARLLVTDGSGTEVRLRVAHEALLTNWERAQRQLARDRRDLETRARIEQAAMLWSAAEEGTKQQRLLRDLALVEAEDLLARWGADLDVDLADFIRASTRAERARVEEAVAREREQRELEAEKLRLETEAAEERAATSRRLAGRTMWGLAAALVLTLLAGGAAFQAWQNSGEAQLQKELAEANAGIAEKQADIAKRQRDGAREAQSRYLAARATAALEKGDVEQGLATGIEALLLFGSERTPPPDVRNALVRGQSLRHIRSVLRGHSGWVSSGIFSPDGKQVLTASKDRTARLWDAGTGRQIVVLRGHREEVSSCVQS